MDSVLQQQNAKTLKWIKRIILFIFFLFCTLGLSSCASTKQEGKYEQTASFAYFSSTNTTVVTLTTKMSNPSIFDIKNVYFELEYYNGGDLIGTTKEIPFDIELKHGEEKTFYNDINLSGNVTKVVVKNARAEWANLWGSYEGWFIGTIVGVVIATIALAIIIFVSDGELFDFIGENWWVLLPILVPAVIGIFGSGITGWIALNWVPICIVGGGVVAVAALTGLFFLLFFIFDEFDLGMYIEGKYVAVTLLGLLLIGGFVCGCIFWKWWACLLILLGAALFVFIVAFISKLVQKGSQKIQKKTQKTLKNKKTKKEPEVEENNVDTSDENTKLSKPKTKTKITFESIVGLEEAKEAFREKVILPFEHPEIYEKFGKKAGGGILLYGLPGTGKTMFAEAASNEVNANFIPVKCSDIKSKWYGESEQKIKAIFSRARRSKRAIIFFDEFEAIGAKRTDDSDNPTNGLVPEILAEMQGVGSSNSESTIVVIAATNKPWSIDSAFMRPGRFDEKIYIPLPDREARRRLFELQLSKLPVSNDLDYDYLVRITEGFNGADIKEVCEKLKMSAIKDSLEKGEEQTIGMDDVKRIENSIKSSVSREDIVQLELFESSSN